MQLVQSHMSHSVKYTSGFGNRRGGGEKEEDIRDLINDFLKN